MSTIIDELIVVLGLDTRKLKEGERDTLDSFKKTKESALQWGRDVQEAGQKVGETLGLARSGAAGLLGVLAGGGIASFVDHVMSMDASVGRLSKTTGISVENLSLWQTMVRQVGGSAEDATGALSGLQNAINNVRSGNGMFDSNTMFLLNKVGGLGGKNADQILKQLSAVYRADVASGKTTASQAATELGWLPGMNQSVVNALLDDLKKLEENARKVGAATNETAAAGQKLQERFSLIITSMERWGASMLPFIDKLATPLNEISDGEWKDIDRSVNNSVIEPGGFADRITRWVAGKVGIDTSTWAGSAAPSAGKPGGTTRGDRNNNPGNMEYGPFARAHGATGSDGRFAVFPDWETGAAAQEALVRGKGYSGLTLDQFAMKYAEGNPSWRNTVGGALGLGPGDIVDNQDPRLVGAIRRAEGTGARAAAASRVSNSSRSTTVNISKIDVNAPKATDAAGIADGIGSALQEHWGITGAADSGLSH